MRWFKHLTAASDDDFIYWLEHNYGLEGYARWWKLCEMVGKQIKKGDTVAEVSLPWSVIEQKLRGKRKQLLSYLLALAKQGRISVEANGDVLRIALPKLLKYRDEYQKKSGHAPDTTPDTVGAQNTEDRIQKTEESKPLSLSQAKADDASEVEIDSDLAAGARFWNDTIAPKWGKSKVSTKTLRQLGDKFDALSKTMHAEDDRWSFVDSLQRAFVTLPGLQSRSWFTFRDFFFEHNYHQKNRRLWTGYYLSTEGEQKRTGTFNQQPRRVEFHEDER
jgi:hypothetical protein